MPNQIKLTIMRTGSVYITLTGPNNGTITPNELLRLEQIINNDGYFRCHVFLEEVPETRSTFVTNPKFPDPPRNDVVREDQEYPRKRQ